MASLGTARSKAKDAAIKENLIGVRTSAEIYFTDNGNNYGPDFSSIKCPTPGNDVMPPTMFHKNNAITAAKSINNALTESSKITRKTSNDAPLLCFSDSNTYAVAGILHTEGPSGNPSSWFCVDSSGVGKVVNTLNDHTSPITLPSPFHCK